jgi:ADP-ribose pyrophosphatase YjhB (NUDIX family)
MLARAALRLLGSLRLPEQVHWRAKWLSNPHFLVGVNVVVLDADRRVLLVRHTYRPDRPWGLPGGGLGRDETPSECAIRELREETGYLAELDGAVWVDRPAEADGSRRPGVIVSYRGRLAGGAFRASGEVDAARFVAEDELPANLLYYERDAIRAALGRPWSVS